MRRCRRPAAPPPNRRAVLIDSVRRRNEAREREAEAAADANASRSTTNRISPLCAIELGTARTDSGEGTRPFAWPRLASRATTRAASQDSERTDHRAGGAAAPTPDAAARTASEAEAESPAPDRPRRPAAPRPRLTTFLADFSGRAASRMART